MNACDQIKANYPAYRCMSTIWYNNGTFCSVVYHCNGHIIAAGSILFNVKLITTIY